MAKQVATLTINSLKEINNIFPFNTVLPLNLIDLIIDKFNLQEEIRDLITTPSKSLPASALAGPAPLYDGDWDTLDLDKKLYLNRHYGKFIQRQCEHKGYHLQRGYRTEDGTPEGSPTVHLFILGAEYVIETDIVDCEMSLRVLNVDLTGLEDILPDPEINSFGDKPGYPTSV